MEAVAPAHTPIKLRPLEACCAIRHYYNLMTLDYEYVYDYTIRVYDICSIIVYIVILHYIILYFCC